MADTAYFSGNEEQDEDTLSNNSDNDEEDTSVQTGGDGSDEEKEKEEIEDENEEIEENENENEIEEDDVDDDDVESENELIDVDADGEESKKSKKSKIKQLPLNIEYDNDDDEDNEDNGDETYLKKFDKEINKNYIMEFHPECVLKNYDEIECLTKVIRDKDGIIIDELHRTIPYLTKYERTRILGQRAKQIDSGATPFVKVPENVIEGYLIAILELEQKRIPFIIRRPLPNGGSEYWNVKDLENISF